MAELTHRLVQYAMAAVALPTAAAAGAIVVSGPGPVGTATPGSPLLVDFGPGIGEVFRFFADQRTFSGTNEAHTSSGIFYPGSTYVEHRLNALIASNRSNTGGVHGGSVVVSYVDYGGGYTFVGNDPKRLAFGAGVSAGEQFYPVNTGPLNDLAYTDTGTATLSTGKVGHFNKTYGSWAHGARGYIGFKIELNGADIFGWLDVEWAPNATPRDSAGLIIHGWGYNDEPGGPIHAGQTPAPGPMGLAALAMGAAGVRRSRRTMG